MHVYSFLTSRNGASRSVIQDYFYQDYESSKAAYRQTRTLILKTENEVDWTLFMNDIAEQPS
jgi:hypothetical protein